MSWFARRARKGSSGWSRWPSDTGSMRNDTSCPCSKPLASAIRVAKGQVELEVEAVGFRSATSKVQLAGGDRQRVTVALEKEALPAAPPPAPVALMPSRASSVTEPAAAPQPEGSRGTVRRKVAWGAGISAGLLLAGAVAETVLWQTKRSDFQKHRGPPVDDPALDPALWRPDCGLDEPGRGGAACLTLYNAARQAQLLALVGYGVGGALAITSVVLFSGGRRRSEQQAHLACSPGLLFRGVSCRLAF